MKLPCERGVWYILPSIRACLVQELLGMGLPQKKVAVMLGITPAAVCQYTSRKRGGKVEFGNDVIQAIQELAGEMAETQVGDLGPRICSICSLVRVDATRCNAFQCFGDIPHSE
ncbi:MAG: transcriptional regulator [Methanomicrobiales archaeon]|nr:transcriptional regulator [Methanomicrobiales archaeon]